MPTQGISDLGIERLWTHARVMMLTASFEGAIQAINPAWFDILGWTAEDVVGASFFDLIHPDDLPRTEIEAARLSEGNQTPKFENRYRHADGSYRDIDWTAVSDGEFIHALGRDVTGEKQQREALRVAEESARQAQKMEAIGKLTGGVAHDFNNLLTVIRGSVDLLRRPLLTDARRARYIDAIGETADRAAKLTGQLLSFARRQTLRPETFDVAESLDGLAVVIGSLTGSRITMERDQPDQACFVRADRSQFDTAVVNMVVNARDAIEGEGTITLGITETRGVPAVRAHSALTGPFIAISISDTGVGIAEDDLQRIFEPFFTTKEVGSGTGLGLSQVIGFAKQSGGEVRVESRDGAGATFTLYLPKADEADLIPVIERTPLETSGEGLRVLVVEDNAHVGEFATSALREMGFESVLATSGAEALERLGEPDQRFDVVFSDVVMPGMSGLDLARAIEERYPALPVVLASGYSEVLASDGAHGIELLQKPYSVEQLSQALRRNLTGPVRPPAG